MPTSANHGKRVRDGINNINALEAAFKKEEISIEVLVTELFYTALHMFESALYDFPHKTKRHCETHSERHMLMADAAFDTKSPYFGISRDYKSLQNYSEYARYLSAAGTSGYTPLVPKKDHIISMQLFKDLRALVESIYSKNGKVAPWTQ